MQLENQGSTDIIFDDRSFRFISVKRFAHGAGCAGERALAALVRHEAYDDTYLSAERGGVSVHGPYNLQKLSPESFEQITYEAAVDILNSFCRLNDQPPSGNVQAKIDSLILGPLRSALLIYHLPRIKDAEHATSWILDEFHELVVIGEGEVLVIVMAID